MPVGATLGITLRIPPGGPVRVPVRGRVVRTSQNDEDPDGIWPFKVAVAFEEPVPCLEEYLAQLPTPAAR